MNLVFASGFLAPQQLHGINYFRGLQSHIAQAGRHTAIFPEVPPAGTSETRAPILARAIQQAFPNGPIHIIAHSMGGLDSRTLIARNLNGLADPGRIASLTTVSTPHRGSPVADLLAGPRPDGPRRLVYDAVSQAIGQLGGGHRRACEPDHARGFAGTGRGANSSAYPLSLLFRLRAPGSSADLHRARTGSPLHPCSDGSAERRRGGVGLGPVRRVPAAVLAVRSHRHDRPQSRYGGSGRFPIRPLRGVRRHHPRAVASATRPATGAPFSVRVAAGSSARTVRPAHASASRT